MDLALQQEYGSPTTAHLLLPTELLVPVFACRPSLSGGLPRLEVSDSAGPLQPGAHVV